MSRIVSAVSIARSEYLNCPPRRPTPAGSQAAMAAAENQTVTSPRRTRGAIVGGPVLDAVFRLVRGMDSRLHPPQSSRRLGFCETSRQCWSLEPAGARIHAPTPFKCAAADPGVESEGSGVPTPQASDCSRPHACARPPRSTRRLARWRWPCAHAQPRVPVRPFCDTESAVSFIAPTGFCGGAGESIDPVCRTGLSLWPGESSQPILGCLCRSLLIRRAVTLGR